MSRPLVFLHGWGLSSRVWTPLLEAMSPGLDMRTPDLPGHGTAAPAPASLSAWADAMGTSLPAESVLVGWSLGAFLALELARRHPDHVRRVILIGATPRFIQADDWSCALPAATLDEFRGNFTSAPAATQQRFVALQSLGDRNRKQVSKTLNAALSPAENPGLGDGLQVLADADLRGALGQISQPVRLIHGGEDRLMPLAAAEWLADHLPDARLSVLGDCGHAPFLSRPVDCASLIEGFAFE